MLRVIDKYASHLLLTLGILLRLKHYLENRSFWVDEAWLGVAITSGSYLDIIHHFKIFPGFPMPPMVFMLIEKSLVQIFGNNEMGLRLFPLICGIGALCAFFLLARKFLSRPAFLLMLALFAILEPLVYYSSELKQYSTDLCVGILLFTFADQCLKAEWDNKRLIVFACWGAFALWLANAVIFILPALAFVVVLKMLFQKQRALAVKIGLACITWLISFIVLYKVSLSTMVSNSVLLGNWQGSLLTGHILSINGLRFLADVSWASFKNPCGIGWPIIGIVLFILGIWRSCRRDIWLTILFILPILLTLTAALLGKYPFRGRMILFLIPFYLIVMGMGIDALLEIVKERHKRAILTFISMGLLFYPAGQAGYFLLQGRTQVDNRPVLSYFNDHYQPGDFVFVNTTGQFPFWYYAGSLKYGAQFPRETLGYFQGSLQKGFKLGKFARTLGDDQGHRYILFKNEYNVFDDEGFYKTSLSSNRDDVHLIPEGSFFNYPDTGRSWVFVSCAPEDDDAKINAMIIASFDRRAKRLLSFERKDAAIYLYDLRNKENL